MKILNYISLTCVALFVVSCGNDEKTTEKKLVNTIDPKVELTNQIQRLEGEMHRSLQIDNVIAGQAIQAYVEYSSNYPDDTLSPDYLFKSGEIATAMQQYPQAVTFYKKIVDKYPNYKLIQESLFLQAAVLDNYLNKEEEAKVIYKQLIEKYPASHYADDAKAAINNLGKTDEQLMKEFQKKNGLK